MLALNKIALSTILTFGMALPAVMITQTASAAVVNDIAAARNLNTLLANTRSMTANFTQNTTGGKAGAQNFSGTMQVQRPNKFRWEVGGSAAQLIVANGNTLWIYDKDLHQVTKQSVNNQVGETPALLLSGNPAAIANSFNVTQPYAGKNFYQLFPKSGSGSFKTLSIAFNGGNPVVMVLEDNLGQTTTINFSNIKRNAAIGAGQFNFTPPKGADVIVQ